MPTYDYECRDCGNIFEVFKSISDDSLPNCPKCNSKNVVKLIGAGAGIIFKGSGFYITDYKNNNKTNINNNKTNISKKNRKPSIKNSLANKNKITNKDNK